MVGAQQNLNSLRDLATPLSGMFVIVEVGLANSKDMIDAKFKTNRSICL